MFGLAGLVLVCGCDADASDVSSPAPESANLSFTTDDADDSEAEKVLAPGPDRIDIPTRVFSASPTLGMKATSVSDHNSPNYGALAIFFDKVTRYTRQRVAFHVAPWSPDSPSSIIQQVGINDDTNDAGTPRDSAYDSGGALNPVWGFVYNSTPFGLQFDLMVRFLYDAGGLALAQSIVDKRGMNVKLLPVVGSNPQGSGYFKQPIGSTSCEGERDCLRQNPIGLAGLCQAGWTFRYLPPAQNVLERACDQLVKENVIPAKKISFVSSIGGQSVLRSVQLGNITAFEYATPADDFDPPPGGLGYFSPLAPAPIPSTAQNPGHKGLRFAHYPSWHQPFYIGWIMVNKTAVWDRIPRRHQVAIERAAREAVEESYWYSKSRQCQALQKILDHNNGQVQVDTDGKPVLAHGRFVSADMKLADWPKEALARLKIATEAHLESLKGGYNPTLDQQDYAKVITALRIYMARMHYTWDAKDFDLAKECQRCSR